MKLIFHIIYLLIISLLLGALFFSPRPSSNIDNNSPKENTTKWSKVYETAEEDYYDRNLAFLGTLQSIKHKADQELEVLIENLERAVQNQNWKMFDDPLLDKKLEFFNQGQMDPYTKIVSFLCLDFKGQMEDPASPEEVVNQLDDIWFVGYSPYSEKEIILFGYVKLKSGLVMKSMVIVDTSVSPYQLSVFKG